MCGLAAVINGTYAEVKLMGKAIKHRGLTNSITEIDNLKVSFSYLPITDQSAPAQPFKSGPYYVWMNGYISNYRELCVKFGIQLSTNCDTEFLAKFFELFDLDLIGQLNGFFSIIAYNEKDKRVNAFTDRYGCKQLYKYEQGHTTYIASEVKSLLAISPLRISERSVKDWEYSLGVMNEHTIYEGVKRVKGIPFIKPLIDNNISYPEAKERLNYLLNQSVLRNKTDLPDGVFLSGGIDSGILAKRLNPDYCFSMDYLDKQFSEIENIKLNSGGIHISMICNEKLCNDYLEKTSVILDDLKAGSSYTNTALTETASKFCTILYSGAGSDEIFDGYVHRYNKSIQNVIKRTSKEYREYPDTTHREYDWKFLKAVLVVEDRMSGFYTMETRYPFLDNDVVNFALSLPAEFKKNKRILRDISGLDERVVKSKKRGFSNPYLTNDEWAQYMMAQKLLSLRHAYREKTGAGQ